MYKAIASLILMLFSAGYLQADLINTSVLKDTYIRNDSGGSGLNWDGDTDFENLIGSNFGEFRTLMTFDVSPIVNAVNTVGGGNWSNLTINSASLTIFERRGFVRPGGINLRINVYGFNFVENLATWPNPAPGDVPGGTLGASLFNGTVGATWDDTSDNNSQVLGLNGSSLAAAIQGAPTAGQVNFISSSSETEARFFSIASDTFTNSGRHLQLSINYTVTAIPEPCVLLPLGFVVAISGCLRRRSR